MNRWRFAELFPIRRINSFDEPHLGLTVNRECDMTSFALGAVQSQLTFISDWVLGFPPKEDVSFPNHLS
jgi:hypothetical protein